MVSFLGEKDARALLVRCSNKYTWDDTDDNTSEDVDHKGTEKCEWTGELGDLSDHVKTCPLQAIPCPNGCTENGEDVLVVRRHMQKHLATQCLSRNHFCQYCRQKGNYIELSTVHLESCPKLPTPCPNNLCSDKIARDELTEHVSKQCPHSVVPCPQSDLGCNRRMPRKEVEDHIKDVSMHISLARGKVESLEHEIITLKESMAKEQAARKELESIVAKERINQRGIPMTFKMSSCSSFLSNNKPLRSNSFYTSPRGYRMCVIIERNVTSKAMYLALYAHLMKGNNDDNLSWPIMGTVTFELLNQLGNHSHKKAVGTFQAGDKDNCRLIDEGRSISRTGYGCPKFISCSKLAESSPEVQYLKDDTLFWRVTHEVPDTLDKHWLNTDKIFH